MAVRLVEHFLCSDATAEFGPYFPLGEERPVAEPLLPGRHYRLQMLDRTDQRVDVQVFLGIGELGGLMWEQDIRALLRIAGSAHPALPEVFDGGYRSAEQTAAVGIESEGMAFVVTRGARKNAGPADVTYFRSRKEDAVRKFRSLVDGLATLHGLGMTHRSLSPAAIDVYRSQSEEDKVPNYRFARFELSALVTDLFRQQTFDSVVDQGRLRELYITHSRGTMAYAPPERLAFVLADDDSNLVEDESVDVYGLAAIMWEWFLGEFPDDQRPPEIVEPPTAREAVELAAAYRRFRDYLRKRLREDEEVPPELATILGDMLSENPADRPAAADVVMMLTAGYDRIMSAWSGGADTRPHTILFMPKQSASTIHLWNWISQHPSTPTGAGQLVDFITDDLHRARMAYSPHGADSFVGGGEREAKRAATIVLRGEQAVWFCEFYRFEDEYGNPTEVTDRALVIKYVAKRSQPWVEEKVRKLNWGDSRAVPPVKLESTLTDQEVLRGRVRDQPSWKRLTESLRPSVERSEEDLAYQRAIDWLIDYQDVELKARTYPYEVVSREVETGEVLVRYDGERDQKRIVSSPLFVKYAASPYLRDEFGAFFGALQNDDGGAGADLLGDENGRPKGFQGTTDVLRREGPDRIVLRWNRHTRIPDQGWLRPSDDRGAMVALERQRDARYELFDFATLRGQIRQPHTIRTLEHHWAAAGEGLLGDGPKAVREILVCEPFMALQGPPGTGKTTVAAAAIAAYLRRSPTARLLVSAQSNFALDNLADRVLAAIGALDDRGRPVDVADASSGLMPLRVTSRGPDAEGRVAPSLRLWMRHASAERLAKGVHRHVTRVMDDRTISMSAELADVLTEWRDLVGTEGESVLPELSDRVHRGANLVFATCATSTPELLSPTADAVFDWVVVEEAAKAWPTELAIPLVRGRRWTLVGDQSQLPAHRRQDIARFLRACVDDPHQEMAALGVDLDRYLEAFDLFGSLFKQTGTSGSRQAPPLLRMGTQFRMREPIAEVVSRVFYPAEEQPELPSADGLPVGGLVTNTASQAPPIRFQRPGVLDGESLVWLDTDGIPDCKDEPHWSNPGEVAVVHKLLERLQPFPRRLEGDFGEQPIAVLSPYREQVKLLRGSSLIRDHVNTIHGFQGREADMVIVSLVRDTSRPGRTLHQLGHLAQRELVNVLFSRARRQLVIVGNFGHFSSISGAGGLWQQVCTAVRLYGKVVPAAEFAGGAR
ncbi:AAA domain-containing protein [Saccharothrix deserti]|uniref:AAA domain-containing protein n=1 Tax=Saccharothrix deserti TaxID=2593674 RepID=UPI00131D06D5|nr:AAA domain-containing protein [Saccharothrix deserti]